MLQITNNFDFKNMLMGGEDWSFLLEVALRTFIMFLIILISLRLLGKRGVKQLSIFELVVIIGLGSAASDPMFYKNVGIIPALSVFILIIVLYKFLTYLIGINKKFEFALEGKPGCLIKDGVFSIENFKKETLGADEFFSELRMQGISQLGQIDEAIEESSGNISIFYYPDQEVKYGLPIMPGYLDNYQIEITKRNHYSCTFCGYTQEIEPISQCKCPTCLKNKWVPASNRKRIN